MYIHIYIYIHNICCLFILPLQADLKLATTRSGSGIFGCGLRKSCLSRLGFRV